MVETNKKTKTTKVVKKAPVKAPTKVVKKAPVKAPTKVVKKPKNTVAKIQTTTKIVTKSIKKVTKKVSVFSKCTHNLNFIRRTFFDIFLLFQNFIHWNISKLIIFVWSIVLWFISIIPFVIIFFIYTFYFDVNIGILVNWMLDWTILDNIFGKILLLLIIAIYFIIFSYSNILLLRLNNSYIEWKKIDFMKNDYFKIKKITKYFNLSLLNISIMLIPILLFTFLMWILFFFSGSKSDISELVSAWFYNYFTILSFTFLIICSLLLAYTYYRIVFSYLIMLEDNHHNKSKSTLSYIKESINKTKSVKKFLKFSIIIVIFVVLTFPINYIGKVLDNNWKFLNDYISFISLSEEQKTNLSYENMYYFENLKLEFNGLTTNDVTNKIKQNYIYLVLFTLLNFVFLYWLFLMIFSSFYKRELV